MRPCTALNAQVTTPSSPAPMSGASSPDRARTPTGARPGSPAPAVLAGAAAVNKSSPNTAMALENTSRKQLYAICAASPTAHPARGDILSLDLSPKEDGQPVIMVTFSLNGVVVQRMALPCASIAALQMYPFITVMVSSCVHVGRAGHCLARRRRMQDLRASQPQSSTAWATTGKASRLGSH